MATDLNKLRELIQGKKIGPAPIFGIPKTETPEVDSFEERAAQTTDPVREGIGLPTVAKKVRQFILPSRQELFEEKQKEAQQTLVPTVGLLKEIENEQAAGSPVSVRLREDEESVLSTEEFEKWKEATVFDIPDITGIVSSISARGLSRLSNRISKLFSKPAIRDEILENIPVLTKETAERLATQLEKETSEVVIERTLGREIAQQGGQLGSAVSRLVDEGVDVAPTGRIVDNRPVFNVPARNIAARVSPTVVDAAQAIPRSVIRAAEREILSGSLQRPVQIVNTEEGSRIIEGLERLIAADNLGVRVDVTEALPSPGVKTTGVRPTKLPPVSKATPELTPASRDVYEDVYASVTPNVVPSRVGRQQPVDLRTITGKLQTGRPIASGYDQIMSQLYKMGLPEKDRAFIRKFMRSVGKEKFDGLSAQLDDLGVDIPGAYDFKNRLFLLSKELSEGKEMDVWTIVHELWHSLSRYLPEQQLQILNKEFIAERNAAMNKHAWFKFIMSRGQKSGVYRVLSDADAEQFHKLFPNKKNVLMDRDGKNVFDWDTKIDGRRAYRFMNIDEFMAEELTRKTMPPAKTEGQSLIGKIKQMFNDIVDSFKRAFPQSVKETVIDRMHKDFLNGKYQTMQADKSIRQRLYEGRRAKDPMRASLEDALQDTSPGFFRRKPKPKPENDITVGKRNVNTFSDATPEEKLNIDDVSRNRIKDIARRDQHTLNPTRATGSLEGRNLAKEVEANINKYNAKLKDPEIARIREQNLLGPETISDIILRKRGIISDTEAIERAKRIQGTLKDVVNLPKGSVATKEQYTAIEQIVQQEREINQKLRNILDHGGVTGGKAERNLIENLKEGYEQMSDQEILVHALQESTTNLKKAEIVLLGLRAEAGRSLQALSQTVDAVDNRLRILYTRINRSKKYDAFEKQALTEMNDGC